ncbi:MAG: hypothetical protein AB7S26_06925 [Sandaracinaceae bacterium]
MSELFVTQWAFAFLFTQCVEMAVYTRVLDPRRPLRERLAIAFGASAITHPLVWFVIPPAIYGIHDALGGDVDRIQLYWVAIAVAELFAFTAEALWLRAFGLRIALAVLASLLANGASFVLGLFGYELLGW